MNIEQDNRLASAQAVRAALGQVLDSEAFSRAQRMRELLHFLVEQKLSGTQRDTQEYAVGIEVFKRDPACYNTSTDPIVRVQMGRLRERLRSYYGRPGGADALQFNIPIGSYMPEIVLSAPPCLPPASPPAVPAAHARQLRAGPLARQYLLALSTLRYCGADADGAGFTRGLDEELVHQLYCAFGATIVPSTAEGGGAGVSHRLEGSVRAEAGGVRLSLRLVDNTAGSVVWSGQFDGDGARTIALQDRLAALACATLTVYFAHG